MRVDILSPFCVTIRKNQLTLSLACMSVLDIYRYFHCCAMQLHMNT